MKLGFSYVGLIYLIMLFVPNFIWTKNKPQDYDRCAEKGSGLLQGFERVGQAAVCCVVLIFDDFNFHPISVWTIWLALSFGIMLLYEFFWWRYFKSPRRMSDFYRSLLGIPVAGASLPVAAFLLLGIYGKNLLLIAATAILGVGHIGIYWNYKKEIEQ